MIVQSVYKADTHKWGTKEYFRIMKCFDYMGVNTQVRCIKFQGVFKMGVFYL